MLPPNYLRGRVLQDNNTNGDRKDNNLLDNVGGKINEVLTTNPNAWTSSQKIGVAVGTTVAILLLVLLCWCGRRHCCSTNRRKGTRRKNGGDSSDADLAYYMKRPYVKRTNRSATPVNAMDPSTLPLGAQLHGALKLRDAQFLGQGVRVAVIDSGIDKDHPGFHGMVKRQVWFRKGTPLSKDDHGTHVAGTIHLLAPKAELYDYRVFGAEGEMDGDNAIAASIMEAVDVDQCHVINMSLRVSYPIVPAVRKAVEYAYAKGVHMVCAAGNSGDGDPTTNELYAFPARWKETISVAAVKKAGKLPVAYFSESNPEVDFAAIGVDVTSLKPGGGYQSMQGTSMAAPHVAGLIAALLSNDGSRHKPAALKKILSSRYAVDIGAEGRDSSTGVGFVTFLSKEELEHFLAIQKLYRSSSATSSTRSSVEAYRAQPY